MGASQQVELEAFRTEVACQREVGEVLRGREAQVVVLGALMGSEAVFLNQSRSRHHHGQVYTDRPGNFGYFPVEQL